jgi:hypothetical protein
MSDSTSTASTSAFETGHYASNRMACSNTTASRNSSGTQLTARLLLWLALPLLLLLLLLLRLLLLVLVLLLLLLVVVLLLALLSSVIVLAALDTRACVVTGNICTMLPDSTMTAAARLRSEPVVTSQ